MSLESFQADLKNARPGSWHDELLQWCKEKVNSSRQAMSERYDAWDQAHEAFRSYVAENRDDRAAEKRDEPKRQAIPVAFAQVETFVSFLMTLFLQRERVFELRPTGEEDNNAARLAEAVIDKDLRDNVFESVLYKFLLNIAKYNIGIIKTSWREVRQEVEGVVEETPSMLAGQEMTGEPVTTHQYEKVSEGNRIVNISPYAFFPDPNFPISRFQEGEFVASEEVMTRQALLDAQLEGDYVGVEHISDMPKGTKVDTARLLGQDRPDENLFKVGEKQGLGPVVVTEVQATIIPSKFTLNNAPLGPQEYPVKYQIHIANDSRIINIEPLSYPHGQYCYDVGEFTADDEELISNSLVDNVRPLQDTASWLVSSHVANVRKVIKNKLVVDPAMIDVNDLHDDKPFVRLKTAAQGTDVRKAALQLDVRDVTAAHMGDSKQMYDLSQVVTGISDNAMGQFASGRRSALEARNVNAGAAMRLKMHGILIFRNALEPMARKMLACSRAWLTVETFVRVRGELADPLEYAAFVAADRSKLVGSYDFEVFDGTLPSERGAQAQALQEFLQFLGSNPEAIMLLGYDPRKIMKEWLLLRGIHNPDRFKMTALRQKELQLQMQQYGIGRQETGNGAGAGPAGGTPRGAGNPAV